MKDHSPLIPSGSPLEQLQHRKTKVLSTVFVIVAAHVLPITGLLLMQGCKPDADSVASNSEGENPTQPLGTEKSNDVSPSDEKELYGEFVSNHDALSMPIDKSGNIGEPIKQDPASVVAPSASNELDSEIPDNWVIKDQTGQPVEGENAPISENPINTIDTAKIQTPPAKTGLVEHEVQPGDVLSRIARKYQTTLKDLLEANPGVDPRRLRVGYKLVVPSGTALLAKKADTPKSKPVATSGKTYVVKAGDSLSAIARAHGVTLNNLRNANNIRTHIIHPGQKLQIPIKNVASGK